MILFYDNIIYSLQKSGGISCYWYELTKRMLRSPGYSIQFYERKSAKNNIFRSQLEITEKQIIEEITKPKRIFQYLPITGKIPKNSIFHSSYYRIPKNKYEGMKQIVTVHDFIYEKYKPVLKRTIHKFQKNHSLKNADGIICISENTKSDLLTLYPEFKGKKIRVIYNGISDKYFKIGTDDVENLNELPWIKTKKYAIFIGDRSAYKNFPFAIDLIHEIGNLNLIIIGGGELSSTERNQLRRELGNRYHHYLNISSEKLNVIYNNAEFLVYPSFYEGFGIPVIEAMRCGCPVIALNSSSIKEVTSLKGLLMNSLTMKEGLRVYDNISSNRSEIVTFGLQRSKQFSWEKCFEETIGFYQEIIFSPHS